jgi:hypothetical protein
MALHIDLQYVNLISCYFEKFTRKGNNLFNVRCPICGDSQTKKTKMRGYIYQDKQRLAYKCHNCNVSMWLGGLIKQLAPNLYKEYLFETFKEDRPDTNRNFAAPANTVMTSMRFGMVEPAIYQHAEKISDLPEDHYCRQYVKKRGIPQEFWNKLYFTKHYLDFVNEIAPDHGKNIKDEPRLVIPFYDAYGAIVAVSGRALDDSPVRYITIRTTKDADKLVYGLERVDQSKVVYITEGPLDSLFLDNAVASGDANLILTAKRLSAAQIVLVFDNEPRSAEIVKQMEKAIKLGHSVVIWPEWIKEKDVNAMILAGRWPKDIIPTRTFTGLTALMHLTHWKKTSNNKGVLV